MGAHLDSWDVGQGAHDDGAGVVMAMQALTRAARLESGPAPHRPRGAVHQRGERPAAERRATPSAHRDELPRHVAALESDVGGGRPLGLAVPAGKPGLE